jgi:two-component system, LuxR family, sensor kinase FixL
VRIAHTKPLNRNDSLESMSWVTVIFSMVASCYLTLALIFGFIWARKREMWVNLLFAGACVGSGISAVFELVQMRAESPAQFAAALRWEQVFIWLAILALAVFVRLYLRAGRAWLLWTVCGLRTLSLFLNFSTGQNLNYLEVSSLGHPSFLGESIAVGRGVPNPWMLVGQLSVLWLVIFVVDAAIAAWRRGDRRMAAVVGGSFAFCLLAGTGQAALTFWGYVEWPLTASLFIAGVIAAMAYQLASDASRAAKQADGWNTLAQQMSLAAKAANLGFWFRDYANNEIEASDQWRAQFGFAKLDRPNLDSFLQRVHPDDRDIARRALAKANEGHGCYQTEYRVLLPDGRMRWIASQGLVEFAADGTPVRLHGVSLDITGIRQADLEAQAHRIQIAHLLRVASLAELSSTLANELRQPLTAILSNAQAAQLYLSRETFDVDEIRSILRDIVASERNADKIIARIGALRNEAAYNPQPLDANELIQQVLRMTNHDLTARGVAIVTELADNLPAILGDRLHLEQVLINLILNASEAMAQAQAQNPHTLTLRSNRAPGSVVQISVTDTGGGIPSGHEEKIFEPRHTTKPQGVGLGLSLSRSIASNHGGRLWAENHGWGGATFHFTLPEWNGELP